MLVGKTKLNGLVHVSDFFPKKREEGWSETVRFSFENGG